MISRRSEVFLTGKNLDRGTFIPRHLSKHFIAAPTAVWKRAEMKFKFPTTLYFWLKLNTFRSLTLKTGEKTRDLFKVVYSQVLLANTSKNNFLTYFKAKCVSVLATMITISLGTNLCLSTLAETATKTFW